MTDSPVPDVTMWEKAKWRAFFHLVGKKLEEFHIENREMDISKAVDAVAQDLAGDDAGGFADDIYNESTYHDCFYEELDARRLVWITWTESRTGGAAGVKILDFGTGMVFAACRTHRLRRVADHGCHRSGGSRNDQVHCLRLSRGRTAA